MDRWNGKIAVVTRAGSSLAQEIIKELIKYGMIVVGLSFRYNSMDDIKEFLDIENAPGIFYPRVCNIKYKEDIEETLNWVKHHFGSLNVLVNNTGYLSIDDITEIDYNDYVESKEISIYGVSNCAIHAAKLMKDNPKHESHILNVNSDINLRFPEETKKFSDFIYEMSTNLVRDFVETQDIFLSSKTPITDIVPFPFQFEPSKMPILREEDVAAAVISALSTPYDYSGCEILKKHNYAWIKPVGDT